MTTAAASPATMTPIRASNTLRIGFVVMIALFAVAPFAGVYEVFLMKALCFALFACAFNLLLGFGGLLSFGHAMFLGTAGYVSAYAAKIWGLPFELAVLTGTLAAAALGTVVGAFVITGLENYLARFGEWVTVITGLIFVICVLAFRRGIVGELGSWWERRAR